MAQGHDGNITCVGCVVRTSWTSLARSSGGSAWVPLEFEVMVGECSKFEVDELLSQGERRDFYGLRHRK